MASAKKKSFMLVASLVALVAVIGIAGGLVSLPHASSEKSDIVPAREAASSPHPSPVAAEKVASSAIAKPQTSASLAQHADVAASFEVSHMCARAYREADEVRSRTAACDRLSTQPDAQARCRGPAGELEARMESAKADLDKCGGLSASEARTAFYESTVEAARAGNVDAQVCYLQSDFDIDRPYTEDEKAAYGADGQNYINAGIQRGDWRVVQLMMTRKGALGSLKGLLPLLMDGDPVQVYRMNRLERLGATGAYAQQLDALAMDPQQPIPLKDAADAEAWAQKTFNAYFSGSPPVSERPMACQ